MIKNQKGFTLVEVLMASTLTAVGMFMVSYPFYEMISRTNKLEKKLSSDLESLWTENFLYHDLRNIGPSFSYSIVKDDSGKNFFDYYPDVPLPYISSPTRTLTLKAGGKTEIIIIQADPSEGEVFLYDPSWAYTVGTATGVNVNPPLTFISLNKNGIISNSRPGLWQNDHLIMLDTPAMVRPIVSGNINMLTAPRSTLFIGKVAGGDLTLDSTAATIAYNTHPESGVKIDSADTFLRSALPLGGGSSFVRVRGVRLVKYYLEPYKVETSKKGMMFFRAVYDGTGFGKPFLIGEDVVSVTLNRKAVTTKLIEYSIEKALEASTTPTAGEGL